MNPQNTIHRGDLVVTADNLAAVAHLTEVTGWLYIRAENAQLPVLTSVGGWLDIRADGRLDAPNLRTISGHELADAQ